MILRRHSNLATFVGLEELRRIYSKLNNCSQEAADIIRYDYQIMGDLVWLLTTNGLKTD